MSSYDGQEHDAGMTARNEANLHHVGSSGPRGKMHVCRAVNELNLYHSSGRAVHPSFAWKSQHCQGGRRDRSIRKRRQQNAGTGEVT